MITNLLNEVNEKIETLNDLVQNKEYFEKLDERIEKANNYVQEQKQEIERLNNIINEGKIYCEDVIQEHENGEYNVSTTQLAIEEHKKNIMSLLNILNGDLKNYWRGDKE